MPDPVDYTAVTGVGTTLKFKADGAGGADVPIDAVLDLTGAPLSATVGKYTPLADGVERVAPGKKEASQITVKVVFKKERQAAIEALHRVVGTTTISYPGGGTEIGHGFLSKVQIEQVSADNAVTASLTWDIDGGRTFAAA